MAQLKRVAEPFGEVNVNPAGAGRVAVRATVLMTPRREGTQTGIALDGSGSMSALYGGGGGFAVSAIFRAARGTGENQITPVARRVTAYLARTLDADQGTTAIYWATGPGGSRVEVIGDLTASQAEAHTFAAPRDMGTGTRLLPAVTYFIDRFADAPFGFYAFLTDGELHDLDEVKAYTRQLAKDIAAGRRKPVKLVLIGLGADVNERQMEELDDLDTGDVDVWDHKLASELGVLERIFAEVVDRNARVAASGKITLPDGTVAKDYTAGGVPAVIEFEAPAGAEYFTLHLPSGVTVHQGLNDRATLPAPTQTVAAPSFAPAAPAAPAAPSADFGLVSTEAKSAGDMGDLGDMGKSGPTLEKGDKEDFGFDFDDVKGGGKKDDDFDFSK